MKAVEKALSRLDKYLYSIKRDTVNGWYVLEVGIPTSWTHKSVTKVSSEEMGGTEKMKMIEITPNEEYEGDVSIDDLLDYASQVISNNKKIEKMREDFEKKMEHIKEKLEEEYEKFEEEIEELEEGLYDENGDEIIPQKKKVKKKTEPTVESETE